jgi:hypothetical protein
MSAQKQRENFKGVHHSFKNDLLRNEKRGEGKETERRPERRREMLPLRRYPPRRKRKFQRWAPSIKLSGKKKGDGQKQTGEESSHH